MALEIISEKIKGVIKDTYDDDLKLILTILNKLIRDISNEKGEISLANAHKALLFIEAISIDNPRMFFSEDNERSTTMAERFKEAKIPTLLESASNNNPYTTLGAKRVESNDFQLFAAIHNEIIQTLPKQSLRYISATTADSLTKHPRPVWACSYPLSGDQIMNDKVGRWQERMALDIKEIDSNSAPLAYPDFKRSVSIRGFSSDKDQELDELIAYLVNSSKYNPEEKKNFEYWLKQKGGQGMNDLFKTGPLLGLPANTALGSMDGIMQDWTIEEGNIVCNYDIAVYSFISEDGDILQNDGKGNLIEKPGAYTPGKDTPIFRVKAKFTLDMEDEVVLPKMVYLHIENYCPEMQRPEIQIPMADNENSDFVIL